MSLATISYDEAKAIMEAKVAEKGADHVVECFYYGDDGTPECIVGQVLAEKGVGLADLLDAYEDAWAFAGLSKDDWSPNFGAWDTHGGNTETIRSFIDAGIIQVEDERTLMLLETAQVKQDCCRPWGEALTEAIKAAEEVQA